MKEDERLLLLQITEEGRKLKEKAVDIPPSIAKCTGLTMDEFKTLYKLTYKALTYMETNSN